jgi:hypothetical protein
MNPPTNHRCGKHVVRANATSPIPVWIACPVHRSPATQTRDRFTDIIGLEFFGEEILRLRWAVEYGMLDG